ncbi:MAG: hypothetical protein PHS30_10450, partial [Bacteroidales bacterium]|nr:hypothetical protein [Bacteroidales bacterium]
MSKLLPQKESGCSYKKMLHLMILGVLLSGGLNAYAKQPESKTSLTRKENGLYEIKVADVMMEVDADHGARIVSFRWKDQE